MFQLREAFQAVSEDNASNKNAILAAERKDGKSAEVVS